MAWHSPYRLNSLHYAVSMALLCAMGTAISLPSAEAATIGRTTITSSQHEPLVAVISISDIKSSDFSASLANSVVYQQMGLTPTDSMSVNFVATSASTGQVIISTLQPVSKPFADVVLAINDNGQRNVIPRTLLMPLGASVPANRSNRVVASATKPNLPVVSAAPTVSSRPLSATNNVKPLALKSGAPPPLFESSNNASQAQSTKPIPMVNQALPTISLASAPNLPIAATKAPSMAMSSRPSRPNSSNLNMIVTNNTSPLTNTKTLDIQSTSRVTSRANDNVSSNMESLTTSALENNTAALENSTASVNTVQPLSATDPTTNNMAVETSIVPSASSSATNVQQNLLSQNKATNQALTSNEQNSNTLNIEITRQIIVRNSPLNRVDSTDSPTLALNFDEKMASLNTQASEVQQADNRAAEQQQQQQQQQQQMMDSQSQISATTGSSDSVNDSITQTASTQTINYTVQRNDNLWLISKQIAEQNNLDISTVMSQIKSQNPDAFINKNADRLKANAQLSLPNYEVVPSESSIQSSIAAQRERYSQAQAVEDKNVAKAKAEPSRAVDDANSKVATASNIPKESKAKPDTTAKTTTQTLPQARFSVVAPNSKGEADGTQTKSATATGNGLDTQVLSSLKSSRQRTAAQAQRVKATSNTVGNYTQKLQLQNQRLAELEARLKKLRSQ